MSDVPNPPSGTPGPAPLALTSPYADHFPCQSWATVAEVRRICEATADLEDAEVQINIDAATEFMYIALGQQFGICSTSFRPCLPLGCSCADVYAAPSRYETAGTSSAQGGCCCRVPQVDCGGLFPVNSIISVHFNGVSQPVADFHIDNYRYIVRNDGERFPTCNIMWDAANAAQNADLEAPFEVAVTFGYDVPKGAKLAARKLACELVNEFATGICALPDRVISYTRQGMTAQVASPVDIVSQGGTGIWLVDLIISKYNPMKLQSDGFVWSPDTRQGGRRTYTN